ncbi:CinA family protein [Pseudooceanicola sp. C21-150M6]|uniref:CinA family protein n=1 Tax=Pseudooceanicola sp. C21-150M6 TaxID=3434355 RepID=UPI003D7FEC67
MSGLAEEVLAACRTRGLTLVTAESCTGGMVAAALTDIAGSSAVVLGGFVTYSNGMKMRLLGVREATLAAYGAVSEPTAREMVLGAMAVSGADLALSITGIAGPGGTDTKPEGMVCFGAVLKGRAPVVETVQFGALGRGAVRSASRDHALNMALLLLK